jgi:hypothetical protein
MVTGNQTGSVGTYFCDPSGCLMAEQHRQWADTITVDHRKIGVADTRRGYLNKYFALVRSIKVKVCKNEWLGLGIRS